MTTDDAYGPYRAALKEDWDYMMNFFKKNPNAMSVPLSAAGDTAFHLSVFSNDKQPIKYLLGIAKENHMTMDDVLAKNKYGDTALHEAAANGNLEAVKLLVEYDKKPSNDVENTEFLKDINDEGETPLFKAAAYGRTKVVKVLASERFEQLIRGTDYEITETGEMKRVGVTQLKDIHRQKITHIKEKTKLSTPLEEKTIELQGASIILHVASKPSKPLTPLEEKTSEVPGASILHVAIQGEHFDTALLLLKLDKGLATLKDENGRTSLHLLATMPSAFKSGYRMGTWISRVFYFCIPIDDRINDDDEKMSINDDDEKMSRFNLFKDDKELCCLNLFKGWWILGKICSPAREICEAKRKHKLALKLAKSLIEEDDSLITALCPEISSPEAPIVEDSKPSSLFMATEGGIKKIVKKILKFRPQLVECENNLKQNILHVAIKHRQKKIFNHVKGIKIPMTRLVRGIDKNGYTILHHAANTRDDSTEIHPAGPVYQLQEELKWYKRVEKMVPPHYLMLRDSKDDKTCKELFNMKHNKLLNEAQRKVKETSQSCFAVAVLAATVVFTAVYNVPGGSNDNGYPVLLNNNLFQLFELMVVVAFLCSLASVVMFLSVFTSPIGYEEFLHMLPGKLRIGFSLLFVSFCTTTIAFAAAFLLTLRFQKPHWTYTFMYTTTFFSLSIYSLTQFPMYFTFKVTVLKFCKWIKKVRRSNMA
ncbi:uncharacterized protein LOC116137561 isoform X2 [Pistacia vera]|uniref:uncharacterized protein LOC116137561 isoform X2 n=1 Tax=Pistacia vera TaxID=55513 RepID=UPI001262F5DF|nr:uncharacterized protein LOC116137561 isoform X2 [Pistacia vera]